MPGLYSPRSPLTALQSKSCFTKVWVFHTMSCKLICNFWFLIMILSFSLKIKPLKIKIKNISWQVLAWSEFRVQSWPQHHLWHQLFVTIATNTTNPTHAGDVGSTNQEHGDVRGRRQESATREVLLSKNQSDLSSESDGNSHLQQEGDSSGACPVHVSDAEPGR